MSAKQDQKPPNVKKLAHQELKKIDGWQFLYIPKYNQIMGIKMEVQYTSVILDDKNEPKVIEVGNYKGKFDIRINSRPTIEFFTREEYNDFVEATGQ